MFPYLQRNPGLIMTFLAACLNVALSFGLVLTARQVGALLFLAIVTVAIATHNAAIIPTQPDVVTTVEATTKTVTAPSVPAVQPPTS